MCEGSLLFGQAISRRYFSIVSGSNILVLLQAFDPFNLGTINADNLDPCLAEFFCGCTPAFFAGIYTSRAFLDNIDLESLFLCIKSGTFDTIVTCQAHDEYLTYSSVFQQLGKILAGCSR